ncbi:hypothetical protein MBANPS3_011210 [Mucor bainieri]
MKSLLLFTVATSFLNAISCAVGKTPLLLEKDILCQSKELNYWNAIILHDFKAMAPNNSNNDDAATTTSTSSSGMDGPLIIGSDLVIDNYYINSKGNIQCQSHYNETIPLTEYGLYMSNSNNKATPALQQHQRYQIKDATISGSIQLHGENKAEDNALASFHDGMVRPMQSCRLLVNGNPVAHQGTAPSLAAYENIAKKTSLYLALQKATHTLTKDGQIKSLLSQPHDNDNSNNDKYYYFNFASCQNNAQCDIDTEATHLSDPGVFSQQQTTADDDANHAAVAWPTDKPIVFNIPVTRDATFKLDIPQALVSQLPSCNMVWNFFTVDEQGVMDESPEQSFTVNRASDTMIGGTFLLPFGNVVDGPSGGFAGQLIASNYESKGASLYDFEAIDASCHITSASCWPHLTRDDTMSATKAEPEPEQEDDLEWMVRRGRQLLPVQEEDQSASMIEEISEALASTTTVVEYLLPSEAVVSGGSASSLLNEYSSLLDGLNPQLFLDEDDALVNPENEDDMAAFLDAHPGQQAGHPMAERPGDFTRQGHGPKTTVIIYTGTRTVTHHTAEQTSITVPLSRVKTMQSTTTTTSYTGTETFTVDMPHMVEARPTGVSFDLIEDRVVTLY